MIVASPRIDRVGGPPAVQRRARALWGSGLILLAGAALAGSAAAKFAGASGVVREMAAAGFAGHKLTLIASLEIVSAALFLWPRTRSVGLLLLSAYLGGAICTHVRADEYPRAVPGSLLLALAWAGTWLRHPQSLWSLATSPSTEGGRL